jgi:hypothetical protein
MTTENYSAGFHASIAFGFAALQARLLSSRGYWRAVAAGLWVLFAVESFVLGAFLFVVLIWAILQFDVPLATRQWGNFLTHYAKATEAQRLPVNLFLAVVLGVFTVAAGYLKWRCLRPDFAGRVRQMRDAAKPRISPAGQFQGGVE